MPRVYISVWGVGTGLAPCFNLFPVRSKVNQEKALAYACLYRLFAPVTLAPVFASIYVRSVPASQGGHAAPSLPKSFPSAIPIVLWKLRCNL